MVLEVFRCQTLEVAYMFVHFPLTRINCILKIERHSEFILFYLTQYMQNIIIATYKTLLLIVYILFIILAFEI